MKQRLLLFLALLLTTFGGARADEVEIGSLEGAESDSYLPMNSLYNYSYTQQIYTADEIGTGGTINSITMWLHGNADLYDMPFDIYMVETDKEAFGSTTDWVAVTEGDIVYSGTVTVHNTEAEAYTFELSTPFEYSGEGNLVIAFNNTTGHWVSGLRGMVFGADSDPVRAIHVRQDGGAYDPYNPTFTASATTYKRNVITLDITPGGSSTCAKPENFVVSDITDTGATFTWDSEVGSYKFEYKKKADAEWTAIDGVLTVATYELQELSENTAYQARVKAVCGSEDESGWKTISFTTENPCAVPANLVASDITGSSATISWTPGYGQNAWTVKYKKTADEEWTETTASDDPTITLEGLDGDTQYVVEVYNECEGSAGASIQFYTAETCPDGKVCIGTGKATNNYLPTYNYYNNSLTQQIYTADEIGDGVGAIMSIDLFKASTSALTRNLDIYIKSIGEKATFDSSTDWIPVTAADLVFSGEVTFGANEWTTIELATPFEYNGSNIVIVVDDNTGSWSSGIPFYVFDATSQAIRAYSDETNFDPSAPSSYTGTVMNVKNRVRLGVAAEMPSYLKPTGLTASEIGPHSAVLSWIEHSLEDVDGWKLAYKTSSDADFTEVDVTTNPFTLTDLAGETAYTVKVRPDSDDSDEDDDKWSKEITFTTDIACPKPDNLAVTNIDKRSATVSWSSLSGSHELRYTTNIAFQGFVTNPGAMADGSDASWLQGSQGTFGPSVNFTSDYLVADDFTVNSAKTLNEIEVYAYQTGSTTTSTFTGLYVEIYDGDPSNGGNVVWGDMANNIMTSTSFTNCYRGDNGDTNGMTRPIMAITASGLNIDLQPGTYWLVFGLTGTGSSGPWLVPYCEPTVGSTGDGLQYSTSEGWIALADDGNNESYGCSMKLTFEDSDNGWVEVNNLTANEYNLTGLNPDTPYFVQVRSYYDEENDWSKWASISFKTLVAVPAPTNLAVDNITARTADLSWTENGDAQKWGICIDDNESDIIEVTEIPATLNNLNPETTYSVKVRAYDEAESEWSQWSASISFTTGIAWPAPTDVAATHILATTADISWTGNDEATGYNLRYKKDVPGEEIASIDFDDSSMGEWTTIDADGDGYTWVLGSEVGDVYFVSGGTLANSGHNGSADLVCSGSYSNVSGALTPDNYLVSPQITLGGRISFYVCGQDANYPAEHFGVAVSTTGNTDPADFTTIAEWTLTANGTAASKAQGTWGQFTVDLSAYEGLGYVAIRHFNCTDQFLLNLDDIVITGPSGESWTTAENVTSPYTIEGLEGSTAYLVQVQAVYADGESRWTQGSFTTKDPNATPTELTADVTATTATLGWAGAQDSYNLRYRSAVPQDPSTPATIILEAHNVWGDNSGYQMLLDANATAYDTFIPVSGALTSGGDADASVYAEFEYKIPENADGALDTQNIVFDGSVTLQIPAGTYDWCITNPTPGDRMWIASSNGNVPGRYDDFVFEPGVTYEFTLARFGDNDGVNLTITRPMGDWVEVNDNADNPYVLTGLTPDTYYEWQVQGNLTEGTTEWSEIASFTTYEDINITFAKEGYATYYNSKKDVVLPAGMKAFVVTGGKGDTHLNYVAIADGDLTAATTNLVPAGVAVMLQVAASTEDGDQTFTVSLAKPSAVADFTGTNHLLGSDVDVEETTGLGLTGTREYFYKLNYPAVGSGVFGWYFGADDGYPFASPAHKAWLVLGDNNDWSSIAELPGHEGATGIQSVAKDTTAAEGWYTISGMKLDKQPTNKGLYIHNGKKVVVE